MTANQSSYRLDQNDQITKHVRTLYRLYMDHPDEHHKRVCANDYDKSTDVLKGGYIESLDVLTKPKTNIYTVYYPWVDSESTVSGDSRISAYTYVLQSDLHNTKANGASAGVCRQYIQNSVVHDSTVSECVGSTITNSTCTRKVTASTITNSTLTKVVPKYSTIIDSTLTSKQMNFVVNANITRANYKGDLAGTYSDITNDNMTVHNVYVNIDRGPECHSGGQFQLLEDQFGHLAILGHEENRKTGEVYFTYGDTTKEAVLEFLNKPFKNKTIGTPKSIALVESLTGDTQLTQDDLNGLDDGLYL